MNMSLLPSCFSILKLHIQRLNYQVFSMKASEAFQVWTKYMENKWEGNQVPPGGRKLNCTLTFYFYLRATELYFTFCVIWGYHVQNSTTQTL